MAKKKKKSASDDVSAQEAVDFDVALSEVEEIVRMLETGEADLNESLSLYEKGIRRLKTCHHLLENAERRVTLLSGFDADGNPVVTEFEEDVDESLETKQKRRSQRRSGGKTAPRNSQENGASTDNQDDPPGLF